MTTTFGYTIIYVPDVGASIAFYERAFGVKRRFVGEDNLYGELDTGTTTLSFSSYEMATTLLPDGVALHDAGGRPAPVEIAFVTDDVQGQFDTAVGAGATPVAKPEEKPWGQTVSYVRDPDGVLIEICSPVAG